MKISVAIPTKDRPEKLNRLLGSLVRQTRPPDELIIMDASMPLTILSNFNFPNIQHLAASEPNLPLQRREAFEQSSGDLIIYFDDDVIPDNDYLEVIEARFLNDKEHEIGGLTGWIQQDPIIVPSSRGSFRKRLGGDVSSEKDRVWIGRGGLLRWMESRPKQQDVVVPCLIGPTMAYRSSALEKIGHQDWLYQLYRAGQGRAEDVMLSSLVRKAGYMLLMVPCTQVIHDHSGGGSPCAKKGYNRGVADTWSRYLCARLVAKGWSLLDKVVFIRYQLVLVVATTFRMKDAGYFRGTLCGLRRVLFGQLPLGYDDHDTACQGGGRSCG